MFNIVLIGTGQGVTDLGCYLEQTGHRCLKLAETGRLLQLAKQAAPDLAIVVAAEPLESLLADLLTLSRGHPLPVILFVDSCPDDFYRRVIEAHIAEFIVDGLDCRRLPGIIHTAIARFEQINALKTALEEARGQLENRKQIDRAKAILIKARNFSEDEAYHTLRKLAMDRNITIGEMAKNVIAMADLLK